MTISAAEVMTTPVISVTPETTVADIASLLAEHRISAMPVCGTDQILLGIVSENDILRPFSESDRTRRGWWLTIAEDQALPQPFLEYLRGDKRTAADVMVRHVIAVEEDATLPHLAELMVRHRVKRLPVLRDGRLVGIVSRADLVAAIAHTPDMKVQGG